MAKTLSWSKGLSSILFWSIISAAFIGPGTVTTAASAGASFGIGILWALVFSIIATIVLQEAAARITIASGKNLGEIIALKFKGKGRLQWFLFLSVAFGCAAYQAGNLLGAISGLLLFGNVSRSVATLGLALFCGLLLWIGNYKVIARLLGLVVSFMGILFVYVAAFSDYHGFEIIQAAITPQLIEGSNLLIISLIGTTIVPYNLFLASGISQGQDVREMRLGLVIAIIIGGLISIAIMLAGTQVDGTFSFAALAETLAQRVGKWGTVFFGLGLFAAGLSSSITAPLAAAVAGQSLLGKEQQEWKNQGRKFRIVWMSILGIGLLLALLDVKPIPAIILAQAINGALLPVIAIFLFMVANDQEILGAKFVNNWFSNLFTLLIVGLSCFIGLNNICKAMARTFSFELGTNYLWVLIGLCFSIVILLFYKVVLKK